MGLFRLALLFCIIATSSSRSVSVDEDLSRGSANVTELIDQINVDLDFDSGEFSEFLRCSTCLVECVRIHELESYFLCKKCLQSCANKTDVFMHFFSSHQCTVTSQKNTAPPPTERRQSVSKPKSGSGVEYLDRYMENRYFSDKCDVTEQQFKDMQRDLSTCKTQLGNCKSGWTPEPDYPEHYPDYPTSSTDYPDYPDETSDNQDGEKSNNPTPTSQTTTLETLEQFGTTFAELAKLLRTNPANQTDLDDDDIEIRNFTNDEIAAIVRKFKSMFVTKQQYEKLMSFTWGKGQAILKTASHQQNSEVTRQAACATRHKVRAPVKAPHRSGRFSVQILQVDNHRQPFIFAECASKIPAFDGLPAAAECRTVPVQRAAIIMVDKTRINDFENCIEHHSGKYICRDWVNVAGACSLFL